MEGLSNLTKLARMTAQMKTSDRMDIFVGTVTALNEDTDGTLDFTCTVMGETDRSIKTGMPGQNEAANNPAGASDTSSPIYPNVSFMCGIDDGLFMTPKVGSQVVVCKSLYHQPFIIQMSAVETWSVTVKNSDNEDNGILVNNEYVQLNSGNWDTATASSNLYLSNKSGVPTTSITNIDATKGILASVSVQGENININGNQDASEIDVIGGNQGKVNLQSGGANILLDGANGGKIAVSNSITGASLLGILTKINTGLMAAQAALSLPSDPSIALDINNLFE